MNLQNIIDYKQFESLFLANWTNILNYKKVIAFVLEQAQLNKNKFKEVIETDLPKKSIQITISYAKLQVDGITLWFDFTIPTDEEDTFQISVGTVETLLSFSGELKVVNIIGNRFVNYLCH